MDGFSPANIKLRDYQRADHNATLSEWREFDRLLGISPTGPGKTIEFANVARHRTGAGPVLVLAHRDELLDQARDKIGRAVEIIADKEKADEHAPLDSRVGWIEQCKAQLHN